MSASNVMRAAAMLRVASERVAGNRADGITNGSHLSYQRIVMTQTSLTARLPAALDPFEGICTFVRSASGPVAKPPRRHQLTGRIRERPGCNPNNVFSDSVRAPL